MISGLTENKLFKIKTFDSAQPYKVGYNGVLDIYDDDDGNQIIKYEIDDIIYKTYYNAYPTSKNDLTSIEYVDYKIKINSFDNKEKNSGDLYKISNYKNKTIRSFATLDSETTVFRKYSKNLNTNTPLNNNLENYLGDTMVEVNGNSFQKFTSKKIFKKERYIGFVSMPEVKSEILIERDELTVFERHQRLSEISNLAELETYRNGYYKIVNTI